MSTLTKTLGVVFFIFLASQAFGATTEGDTYNVTYAVDCEAGKEKYTAIISVCYQRKLRGGDEAKNMMLALKKGASEEVVVHFTWGTANKPSRLVYVAIAGDGAELALTGANTLMFDNEDLQVTRNGILVSNHDAAYFVLMDGIALDLIVALKKPRRSSEVISYFADEATKKELSAGFDLVMRGARATTSK